MEADQIMEKVLKVLSKISRMQEGRKGDALPSLLQVALNPKILDFGGERRALGEDLGAWRRLGGRREEVGRRLGRRLGGDWGGGWEEAGEEAGRRLGGGWGGSRPEEAGEEGPQVRKVV